MASKANAKPLYKIFLEIAKPDPLTGISNAISIDKLEKIDPRFRTTNGGSWCRSDGGLKKYNVDRTQVGGKIVAVALKGYRALENDKRIKPEIRAEIEKMKCVLLLVANKVQVDHKNGRYNDTRVNAIHSQTLDDFQPLCHIANTAKRGHCKQCSDSGKRFDATQLGYAVPVWIGKREYDGSCVGCFWYDPREFNRQVSKNYQLPISTGIEKAEEEQSEGEETGQ